MVPSHSTCMHATKPLAVTASAWWRVAPVWIFVSSESPQTPSLEQRSPPRRPHSRQRPLPQGRAGCARVHAFLGRTRGACVPRAFLMLKGLARLLVRANASQHLSWVYRKVNSWVCHRETCEELYVRIPSGPNPRVQPPPPRRPPPRMRFQALRPWSSGKNAPVAGGDDAGPVSTTQTVLTVGYCCAMVRGIPWARPSNVLTEPAGTAAAAPGHADRKRRSTLHSGAAAAVEAAGGARQGQDPCDSADSCPITHTFQRRI